MDLVALWKRVAEKKVGLATKSEPRRFGRRIHRLPILYPNSVNRPNLVACDRRFSNHNFDDDFITTLHPKGKGKGTCTAG